MTARTIGILLAGGRSRRMTRADKQLLPWTAPDGRDTTIVAAAFDAIAPHCDEMFVTIGHAAEAVRAALSPRHYHAVAIDADGEMFDSIRAALNWVAAHEPTATRVILHPADNPAPGCHTLDDVLSHSAPGSAVMPEHQGRGGHPVVFDAALIPLIINWSGGGGLREFWIAHPECVRRIEVAECGAVMDLDTAEAYEKARSEAAGGGKAGTTF